VRRADRGCAVALLACLALAGACGSGRTTSSSTSTTSSTQSSTSTTVTTTATTPDSGFVAFGDGGTGDTTQRRVAGAMTAWVNAGHRADALVEAGDNVYDTGDPSRFAATLDAPYAELRRTRPFWIALGNHDVQDGHGGEQLRYLGLPDLPYAKTLPDVQLLFLDANHPDHAQAQWLEARLSEPGPLFRVVVFHQPAYACALHGSTQSVDREWVPILEAHAVSLVITAHDHYYERFVSPKDVTYVVTGGGGASLYARRRSCAGVPLSRATAQRHHFVWIALTGHTLTLTAIGDDGTVFDQATIAR
jgi:hypothetical protein